MDTAALVRRVILGTLAGVFLSIPSIVIVVLVITGRIG